jgi:hypothetical protein
MAIVSLMLRPPFTPMKMPDILVIRWVNPTAHNGNDDNCFVLNKDYMIIDNSNMKGIN